MESRKRGGGRGHRRAPRAGHGTAPGPPSRGAVYRRASAPSPSGPGSIPSRA